MVMDYGTAYKKKKRALLEGNSEEYGLLIDRWGFDPSEDGEPGDLLYEKYLAEKSSKFFLIDTLRKPSERQKSKQLESLAVKEIYKRIIKNGACLSDYPDTIKIIFEELGFKKIPLRGVRGTKIKKASKERTINYAESLLMKEGYPTEPFV